MCVHTSVEVTEDTTISFNDDTIYFTMTQDDTPSGFTKLRLLHTNDQDIFEDCDISGRDYYFSSASVKQRLLSDNLSTVHGPCVSDKKGIIDIAYCVRSKSWITSVDQWITRSTNGWPDYDVKNSIVKHAYFLFQ